MIKLIDKKEIIHKFALKNFCLSESMIIVILFMMVLLSRISLSW